MDPAQRHALGFGLELQKSLLARGIGATDLTAALMRIGHRLEQPIDRLLLNKYHPTPDLIAKIARALDAEPLERYRLFRAAAIDRGYEVDPPKPEEA